MGSINTLRLVLRRLVNDSGLMISIFLGVLVTTTLLSGAPVYLEALERQGIVGAIDAAVARTSDDYLTVIADADFVPVEAAAIESTNRSYLGAIENNVDGIHAGTKRHMKMPFQTVALPSAAGPGTPASPGRIVPGFVQHYADLDDHVTFQEGRMATDAVKRGTQGPMVEAIISDVLSQEFDGLSVGDVALLTPSLEDPVRLSVRIVGIFRPTDPSENYWRGDADSFVNPRVPDPEGGSSDRQPLVLGMFVKERALVDAVGPAFPGAVVDSVWYGAVDTAELKTWTSHEMRQGMDGLAEELALEMPGSTMRSGINVLLTDFERSSFLSSVPLLLLMTVMGIMMLYFLFMIVSYLVPARESDIGLFRSRGTGTYRLFKLYLIEGALITVAAVAAAPFLALALVAVSGNLPYFHNITDGSALPVVLDWAPFAAAFGAGVLCLVVFVVPGVLGARAGLIDHRLRASRPPSTPIVQRYYIDIGLLVIGGILFWELQARGQLVSGGLFGQPDVNEALLVAPVLFLLVVGLLFFRVFPMFVKYIGGESQSLVNVVAAVSLLALVTVSAIGGTRSGDGTGWVVGAIILVGIALAYGLSARYESWRFVAFGIAAQATLIGVYLWLEPIDPGSSSPVFVASILIALVVPLQLIFLLMRWFARRAPVWLSLTLWHMARNPLQYSWLILLLVLASGIGVLATTVGATLDRSHADRIHYSVGTDVRVSGLPPMFGKRDGGLKKIVGEIDGVASVTLAQRDGGRAGGSGAGNTFGYLAVETDGFDPWFREDFAADPLEELVARLIVADPVVPIVIPSHATEIRMWVNPAEYYQLLFLWIVLEDQTGRTQVVTMGSLGSPEWHLMSAELPDDMVPPLQVVAIQINEPGFGATGTVGSAAFDELHAVVGSTGEEVLLEGFEGSLDWIPLATSAIGSDELSQVSDAVYVGDRAAVFNFGKDTNRGTRGFRRATGSGTIPVIASSSFAANTGAYTGSVMVVGLSSGLVPVKVVGVVDYFPTVDPAAGGFLIFDLDALSAYINVLSPMSAGGVNEVFVSTVSGAEDHVFERVSTLVGKQGRVVAAGSEIMAKDRDPLISAGWRAMVLVAMLIILFTAGLGYIVYLLAFADRSIGELGALRSLGLSGIQTAGLIGLEHLMVALVGLGVGSWAGFQMSRMMVSSVTVTDAGGRVLPPFILTTDWTMMGPIYGLLGLVFIAALFSLGRRLLRLDLRRLSRQEG